LSLPGFVCVGNEFLDRLRRPPRIDVHRVEQRRGLRDALQVFREVVGQLRVDRGMTLCEAEIRQMV